MPKPKRVGASFSEEGLLPNIGRYGLGSFEGSGFLNEKAGLSLVGFAGVPKEGKGSALAEVVPKEGKGSALAEGNPKAGLSLVGFAETPNAGKGAVLAAGVPKEGANKPATAGLGTEEATCVC